MMSQTCQVLDLDLAARSARRALAPVNLEDAFVRARRALSATRAEAKCRQKIAYRSAAAARNAEILRLSRTPRALQGSKGRPYLCSVCHHWHLTTKPIA